jgi:hypothetical protein
MPNPSEIERMIIADLDAIEKWSQIRVMGLPFQYIRALIAETKRLLADNARLRDALEPFERQAEIISAWGGVHHDGTPLEDFRSFTLLGSYAAITVGDCRRAALALRESEARP